MDTLTTEPYDHRSTERTMPSEVITLLPARTLNANDVQPEKEAADVGAYTKLVAHVRVLKAGTAGNLKLETSATAEVGSFTAIASASWSAAATSNLVFVTDGFARYVRWVADGAVAGAPIAAVELVMKQG